MAVFIVYGNYFGDRDDEREMLYVGTDGEEASGVTLEGLVSLEMEVWVDNKIFKKKVKISVHEWNTTFSLIDDIKKSITLKKDELLQEEYKLAEATESAKSEGLHV